MIEIKHCFSYETLRTVDGESLIRANLRGANLSRADLSDANLSDANLRGADLSGANLWGAVGNCKEVKSLHSAKYVCTMTDENIWIGCQKKTPAEWWSIDSIPGEPEWSVWKPILRQIYEASYPAKD